MSVDCDGVAGIGFELNDENMEKFGATKWVEAYEKEQEFEDGYIKEDNSWGDDDRVIAEFLDGYENIDYCTSGSYYSGVTYKWLCATDPIFGLDDFINDCKKVGFNIEKKDLIFFSETLWC